MATDAANVRAAASMIDQLAAAGVRDICVSPGSRSAPLAIAAASHPDLRHRVITDERDAAFFALGVAKATGRPAAVLCTSGTAAANLLPAVAEAFHARVGLIVITADRPPELRDSGAAQTIRQSGLFASHVGWSVDAPVPDGSLPLERYYGTIACRAVAAARRQRVPVHVNVPFREPLWSEAALTGIQDVGAHEPRVVFVPAVCGIDDVVLRRLSQRLAATERGLLVCGPGSAGPGEDERFVAFARALRWPLLADALSGLRFGALAVADGDAVVVDAYDVLLRSEHFAASHRPDVVVRFGALPTSKVLLRFLADLSAASQIAVWPEGMWADPDFVVGEVIEGEPTAVISALRRALEDARRPMPSEGGASRSARDAEAWLDDWIHAQATVRSALDASVAETDTAFDGAVANTLVAALPDGATLFVGNSIPVRALDMFAGATTRNIRVLANRGANGIDGVTATALGAASVSQGPCVLLTGDLSFLHDIGALQIAHRHRLSLTVVVVNNDGGGIFSFLPRPSAPGLFEDLFATPHGIELARAVEMCAGRHRRIDALDQLSGALADAFERGGLAVTEIRTDREHTVRRHHACADRALAALDEAQRRRV